jgi:hypothetical protein
MTMFFNLFESFIGAFLTVYETISTVLIKKKQNFGDFLKKK